MSSLFISVIIFPLYGPPVKIRLRSEVTSSTFYGPRVIANHSGNKCPKTRWEKQTKQFQYVSDFELPTVDKINPECKIDDITL